MAAPTSSHPVQHSVPTEADRYDVGEPDDLEKRVETLERTILQLRADHERLSRTVDALQGKNRTRVWRFSFRAAFLFLWQTARSFASKMLMNFLTFVYFTKLHRMLLSLSYKYYVLALLR